MGKNVNIDKVIRQHMEMDVFFPAGLSVKGHKPEKEQREEKAAGDARSGLEKIAAEVHSCCSCGLGSTRTNTVPGESGNFRFEIRSFFDYSAFLCDGFLFPV